MQKVSNQETLLVVLVLVVWGDYEHKLFIKRPRRMSNGKVIN